MEGFSFAFKVVEGRVIDLSLYDDNRLFIQSNVKEVFDIKVFCQAVLYSWEMIRNWAWGLTKLAGSCIGENAAIKPSGKFAVNTKVPPVKDVAHIIPVDIIVYLFSR